MPSPLDVAKFHADYDTHTDDRIHLFRAVAELVQPSAALYPGSYVDIAPSVFFHEVHYVDMDKRAATFFGEHDAVRNLITEKRRGAGRPESPFSFAFTHADYYDPLDRPDHSVDLLISLYAGFISEACTRYLRPGGHLLVNGSHGDAVMATLRGNYRLTAALTSTKGTYRARTDDLERYLVPKKPPLPTIEELRASGRGVGYTTPAFAYLFQLETR